MPIRLNLLAEAQAAEDLRRRDPVKRAIWFGGLLVAGMLVWASSLYVKTLMAKHQLNQVDGSIALRTNDYQLVSSNQTRTADVKARLSALRQLSLNRFLYGNLLDAIQGVTVKDVQLTKLRVDQTYLLTVEVKGKTNSEGRVTGAKPATVKESIAVTLEAKDLSTAGEGINQFKEAVSTNAYFQASLSRSNGVRLTFVGSPNVTPGSQPFVPFTIECRYPEITR